MGDEPTQISVKTQTANNSGTTSNNDLSQLQCLRCVGEPTFPLQWVCGSSPAPAWGTVSPDSLIRQGNRVEKHVGPAAVRSLSLPQLSAAPATSEHWIPQHGSSAQASHGIPWQPKIDEREHQARVVEQVP